MKTVEGREKEDGGMTKETEHSDLLFSVPVRSRQ